MKKITAAHSGGKYSILIGRGLLGRIGILAKTVLKPGAKVLIVSNRRIQKLYQKNLKKVADSLRKAGFEVHGYFLPNGTEDDKSAGCLLGLWEAMAAIPLERTSAVIALGGGVVGDVSGFAASTYMRGIRVIQIPTTLLAQVDSAIGGKTAVNIPSAKNIVGTFWQPSLVVSDIEGLVQVLKMLPPEQTGQQFAEVIKCGVIEDPALFRILEQKMAVFFSSFKAGKFGEKEMAFLEEVITRSSKVKAGVVAQDERETKGRRMILNYGHTFGHGFESASAYKMSHGNAVALGMLCAGRLAVRLGIWNKTEEKRQARLIHALPGLKGLQKFSLNTGKILFSMQRDKKKQNGRLRFVLPVRIGKVTVREDIPLPLVRKIIDEVRREQ